MLVEKREIARKRLKAVARWVNKAMSGCFDLWSDNVKEIKRFRLILKRAAKKMMMRAVAMTFSTWTSTVKETKRYRGLLKRAAKKMKAQDAAGKPHYTASFLR